jgi:hypothetical protein
MRVLCDSNQPWLHSSQWENPLPALTRTAGRTRSNAAQSNDPLLVADAPINIPKDEDMNEDSGSLSEESFSDSAASLERSNIAARNSGHVDVDDDDDDDDPVALLQVDSSIIHSLRECRSNGSSKGWRARELGVSPGSLLFDSALVSDYRCLKTRYPFRNKGCTCQGSFVQQFEFRMGGQAG